MKKGWCVVVGMLFLSACGGGDGGDGSSGPQQQVYGAISVTIDRDTISKAVQAAPVAAVAAAGRPAATHVRVAINNSSLKIGNVAFKEIADTAIPGTLNFSVPAAAGYTVEAVTYVKDGTINRVLEYGKSPLVTVSDNTATNVTLAIGAVTVGLNMPVSVTTRSPYTVTATIPANSPLESAWAVMVNTTGFTVPYALTSFSTTHSLFAPAAYQAGTLYAQSMFIMKRHLLQNNESQMSWTYTYPNPLWGDPPVTAQLLVPAGNVTITFP